MRVRRFSDSRPLRASSSNIEALELGEPTVWYCYFASTLWFQNAYKEGVNWRSGHPAKPMQPDKFPHFPDEYGGKYYLGLRRTTHTDPTREGRI